MQVEVRVCVCVKVWQCGVGSVGLWECGRVGVWKSGRVRVWECGSLGVYLIRPI